MKWRLNIRIGLIIIFSAWTLIIASPGIAEAQGGAITYGSSTIGTISAEVPLSFYTFSGTGGDRVHLDIIGLTGTLQPVVDLLGPDRQTLITSTRNFLADNPNDATIAIILPTTGLYSLIVSGDDGTLGDFLLQLAGQPAVSTTPLQNGQPVAVSVPADSAPQYFSFATDACPTTLTILTQDAGLPFTFPYIASIHDDRGAPVAVLRGGNTWEDRVTVPMDSGEYAVDVWAADQQAEGGVTLVVNCAAGATQCLPDSFSSATSRVCPICPHCGDLTDCPGFVVTVDVVDLVATISWPPVEGANAAIVSIQNSESGELIYARLIDGALSDTIDLTLPGFETGAYQVAVTVGSEELGYDLCGGTAFFTQEGEGPVPWGPAADDETVCAIALVAPLDTMANGLQTFFWTEVPGADSYRLRVFGQFDSVAADGAISAPATSMTFDVSEGAIGLGYGGENDFAIQIDAIRDGSTWCNDLVRITRAP